MVRRPDLFIIGAAKCGTTSLYEYLRSHPQVFMSPVKEPRYFSPDVRGGGGEGLRYEEDERRYLALFDGARDEQRLGEASTPYMFSRKAPELVREFQPDAYVVATVRDPVEMLRAVHGQRVSDGREDITDFAEALAADEARRTGRRLPAGANALGSVYLDRARFGEQLQRWMDVFGGDRVHTIVLDDLLADAAGTYARLLDFLDVDRGHQPPSFVAHNAAHRRRRGVLRGMLDNGVTRWTRRVALPRTIGAAGAVRLRQRIRHSRLNVERIERAPVPPELRRHIRRELEHDVALLSKLVGRDLATLWWASQPRAVTG